MRIAICDDEKDVLALIHEKTRSVLAQEDETADIELFSTGESLWDAYRADDHPFDILLLDIKMENMDGIKTAELIRTRDENVLIIFITSSAEYVFRGYEVKAFRYLMKTELSYGLAKVLRDTFQELKHTDKPVFTFQFGAETVTLEVSRILFFESVKRIVRIVLTGTEYKTYAKLTDIENELSGHDFIRCHQSYLVNAGMIEKISGASIVLKNGDTIPVSKRYRQSVNEAYLWTMR